MRSDDDDDTYSAVFGQQYDKEGYKKVEMYSYLGIAFALLSLIVIGVTISRIQDGLTLATFWPIIVVALVGAGLAQCRQKAARVHRETIQRARDSERKQADQDMRNTQAEINDRLNQIKRGSNVNYVTLTFGNGNTFTGPFVVGQNINLSYDMVAAVPEQQPLRTALETLLSLGTKLIEDLPPDAQSEAADNLNNFIKYAKAEKPNRGYLRVAKEGLIEAASTITSLAEPIGNAISAVLKLINIVT